MVGGLISVQGKIICNVVSNGGNLLSAGLGLFVDRTAFIFRFGISPTIGYEKYVGNATYGRAFGNDDQVKLVKTSEALQGTRLFLIRKRTSRSCPTLAKAAKREVTCIVLDGERHLRQHVTQARDPSTGLWAIFWLRLICDEVVLFGFSQPTHLYPYHYFPSQIDRKKKIDGDEITVFAGRERRKGMHNFWEERKTVWGWSSSATTINATSVHLLTPGQKMEGLQGMLWNSTKGVNASSFVKLETVDDVRRAVHANMQYG